jgi:YD repeat-containing protein
MPSRHRPQFALERQLVGDPVDAVTGANVDRNLDLRLGGPLPLLWVRHYDSSRHDHRYSLGWGHAHGFDRWLSFDVDGIRYAGPLGQIIGFPPLVRDGEEFAVAGLVLRRTGPELYQIRERDQPTLEFEPRAGQLAAPLKRLRCGRLSIEFLYDGSDALAGIVDSSGRSIIVDRDENGSILRLRLRSSNGERDRAILAYAYDPRGNLIRGTDGYGNSFTFTYDERRRLV